MRSGRRSGKSLYQAARTAAALRAGQRVVTRLKDPDTGESEMVEVVGVPGFPDGRQLSPRESAAEALPEGYAHHDGGPCPLDPDTFVWPAYRGKANPTKGVSRVYGRAWQFGWQHDGEDDDIVGYTTENPDA